MRLVRSRPFVSLALCLSFTVLQGACLAHILSFPPLAATASDGRVTSRPRGAGDTTWFQAFEAAGELSGRGKIAEAVFKGKEAARLNPTHSYPKFLLYSLYQQTQQSEEARELLSEAMKNHCYHGGSVTQVLQRECQQDITSGNLNLFV